MRHILIFLLSVLSVYNCALNERQVRTADRFGTATESVTDIASREIVRMRTTTIDMNLELLKLGLNSGTNAPDHNNLDETFNLETTSLRIKSIEALRSYGTLIQALGTEKGSESLEQAALNFLENIEDLQPQNRRMNNSQKSALIQSVKLFTHWYTGYKKKQAIKEVLNTTKEQVDSLCDMLAEDFDDRKGKLATQYQITTNRLLVTADESLESESLRTRTIALRAIKNAGENRKRKDSLHRKVSEAFLDLKKANSDLSRSFLEEKADLNDLKSFAAKAKTIREIAQVLR